MSLHSSTLTWCFKFAMIARTESRTIKCHVYKDMYNLRQFQKAHNLSMIMTKKQLRTFANLVCLG
jgi:hypothetical protein